MAPSRDSFSPSPVASEKPGERIDSGRGRIFPCDQCGADLEFSIGEQSLKCPYCGAVKQIEVPDDVPIVERDYLEMLERLQQIHEAQLHEATSAAANDQPHQNAVCCESCGAEVVFSGTLTSSRCPYCASPLQRENVHDAVTRISVDGVLPFLVAENRAAGILRNWVSSLWWAPNQFLKDGIRGKFNGVYLPFFTFDSLTHTRYAGQRGDYYYVQIGSGNNRRTERRIRWTYTDGQFQRFFDDVLEMASAGDFQTLAADLEPWQLEGCVPFTQQLLAGFFARTYDVALETCFDSARHRIEAALSADVRRRIGGDVQNVEDQRINYSAITFKHLLLPVWLLAYRYRDRTYRVMINGATGKVSGERPYSLPKIIGAILFGTAVAFGLWWLSNPRLH